MRAHAEKIWIIIHIGGSAVTLINKKTVVTENMDCSRVIVINRVVNKTYINNRREVVKNAVYNICAIAKP